jgi:GH18 family chitinase
MKTGIRLLSGFFLVIWFYSTSGQEQKEIVGYYPNWQWYDRSQLVDPEAIMYNKYTVINYAFFRPQANGSVTSTDSWADENLLLGPMIWWPVVMHDSTRSLPYLAHQAGVKVMPSIGGWNDSYNFPGIAASSSLRQTFVNSCISLIESYHFDGIDLDWEYPGYAPNGGTPADKVNFTLLLQDLRDGLDLLEILHNRPYLLTSCFSADEEKMMNIEWANVLPLVDMVNLMTYDFHGSWDPESNFNTPMYPPVYGNPDWCINGAFTILTQTFGVPSEKVNIGVAFYGKSLANCTQLYGSHSGYDGSTFWEDEGVPLYYNILKRMNQFTRYWDDQVKCPYLLGNSVNTFVTYDDAESLRYKAQYVKDHNAKGIIIWEITGDYIETTPGSGIISGTPLLDTIWVVFNESIQNGFEVSLKVYLEGAFNGTQMNTTLNGVLPLSHPFNPPLPYFGNPMPDWYFTGSGSVSTIPNTNVVDWVLVELRDAASAASATKATMIDQLPAFILNNGNIVALDGISNLQFSNNIVNNLFVVIYHRNHESIMNSTPIPYISGSYTYDFSSEGSKVYGGTAGHKELTPGVWGMRCGDGDGNGNVTNDDKTNVWKISGQNGKSGYLPSDYNMDSQTNNKDKNDKWRPNNGTGSQVPGWKS